MEKDTFEMFTLHRIEFLRITLVSFVIPDIAQEAQVWVEESLKHN
jgi:hypothetical protein